MLYTRSTVQCARVKVQGGKTTPSSPLFPGGGRFRPEANLGGDCFRTVCHLQTSISSTVQPYASTLHKTMQALAIVFVGKNFEALTHVGGNHRPNGGQVVRSAPGTNCQRLCHLTVVFAAAVHLQPRPATTFRR